MTPALRHAVLAVFMAVAVAFALPTSAQEPLEFYPITPCRWIDTRVEDCVVGGGCYEGPFMDGETRKYLVQAAAVCPMTSRWDQPIPLGARVLIVTIAAVEPTNRGHLLAYDASLWDRPRASTLNFQPGQATSNLAFVALGQDLGPGFPIGPDLAVYARVADGGWTHVVIDIVGYLMPAERMK